MKYTIVIADDEKNTREGLRWALERKTLNIHLAADGEEALQIIRSEPVDILLTDLKMPKLDGMELLARVRQESPSTEVVMLTGHTHIDQVRQARDAGVNEFLAKPVSVKSLMARLVAVIEQPRPYVRTGVYFGPCRRRRGSNEYHGTERRADAAGTQAAE